MNSSWSRRAATGFVLPDLCAVILITVLLVGVYSRARASAREKVYTLVDLTNMRQILQASAVYSVENSDRLAHPTWGGDLTGPDGWAYLTSNRNRAVPGALSGTSGSCSGFDVNSRQFTNQLAYFKVGQVTQYLPGVKTTWCPKDVATRGSGSTRFLWIGRAVKVTSYCWNATIGGYVGPKANPLLNNRTYKVSDFQPTDWQTWEQNETSAFYFNDAGSSPETPGEGLSYRHSGLANWWTAASSQERNVPGVGIVGMFGGSAQMVTLSRAHDLVTRVIPAPNDALNGPGYQR